MEGLKDSYSYEAVEKVLKVAETLKSEKERLEKKVTDMESDMEKLKRQHSLETQELKSQISSMNSTIAQLGQTLQGKDEEIVSLNGHIGRLSESDKVLGENKTLRRENAELLEMCLNKAKEAEAEVAAAKEKYDALVSSLDEREKEVAKREEQAALRDKEQDAEVSRLADKRINGRLRKLEAQYNSKDRMLEGRFRRMRHGYVGIILISVLYGIIVTIITAVKTPAIISDVVEFGRTIAKGAMVLYHIALKAGGFASQLGDRIPQPTIAFILHWVIWILVLTAIFGGLGVTAFLLIKTYAGYFRKKQTDEITAFAILMDLAVTVFLAEQIKTILSVNLVLLFFALFALYSAIRAVIRMENVTARNRLFKYVAITCGCIAGMAVMFRFIGMIGAIAVPIGLILGLAERH